ncbi:pterin-4-alpha-carbinolamine dehydratase [Wenjunlia vitaminophila]|uniref:Putative pterin-4-alpha-carbinolamine dehydratase n=1 Tax=Wenjunlia vitaminophila TaxID=76728 RepID=A0A0T6LTH9_WENVI|nr:4a-hydroxytetrahydrobiopterin dehydratase [Wenjunlia vitaminophila]KRV49328.1 pterin-4-alpha-carbinolamine dehydratase [Wenjunlia vitaminophila]
MPEKLTEDQLTSHLARLPQWRRDGDTLRRTVQARDFPAAIAVVDEVARVAEEMDHHPDIDIRWRTLHFAVSTHSVGGLTELDIQLAQRIDAVTDNE